jgi:hypothetical protein
MGLVESELRHITIAAVKVVKNKNLRRPGHLGDQDINGKEIKRILERNTLE